MPVRLRFMLFFGAGVAIVLVPVLLFFAGGVWQVGTSTTPESILLGVVPLLALAAVCGGLLLSTYRRFDRPVNELIQAVKEISKGNLSPELPEEVPSEFGVIRTALKTTCGQMQMVMSQLNTLSGHVVQSTAGAGDSFREVQDGVNLQSETAARTYNAIGSLTKGLLEASSGIETLARRIDKSATQVSEMDIAIGKVTDTVSGLNSNIEEASQTTRDGDTAARTLARDVVGLSASITASQTALTEMIEGAARAAADAGAVSAIMENLEGEAGRIGAAIEDVIKGSDAAHISNERILAVTANLQSRVNQVDNVIEVIRNLAERTKLLSINASIIASEAGEHGRAFAVVAHEVKDLAQSTAGAISEISKVIVGLKKGFNETIETIQKGQEDVDDGVRLARNAVVLLESLPGEVHKAAACNVGIVELTSQQVEKGAQIEEMTSKVSSTLDRVSKLLSEQVTRNDRTLNLFQNIAMTSDQVLKTSQEQSHSSRDMAQSVETISKDFRGLAEQVRQHVSGLSNVVRLSEDALNITDSNRQRAAELSNLIDDLNRYALYLGEDFRKLTKDHDSEGDPLRS